MSRSFSRPKPSPQIVLAHQYLEVAGPVLEVQERRFPHDAHGRDTASDGHVQGGVFRLLPRLDGFEGLGRGRGVEGAMVTRWVGVDAVAAEALQLGGTVGQKGLFSVGHKNRSVGAAGCGDVYHAGRTGPIR